MDAQFQPLDRTKFRDPLLTAKGETRAQVALRSLDTLWFNTGTLCNLTCRNCYIESSPRNDRLAYLTRDEVRDYLDEIAREGLPTQLIGFTGGEPFMNPDIIAMLRDVLSRGFDALVLTNAMKPMRKTAASATGVAGGVWSSSARSACRSTTTRLRCTRRSEDGEAGRPTIDGLVWLARNGFALDVAGRRFSGEPEEELRAGFARLFAELDVPIDAADPVRLMLFPEMDAQSDVPEITTACWGILHKSPDDVMCASARMVVKRRDAATPDGPGLHIAGIR